MITLIIRIINHTKSLLKEYARSTVAIMPNDIYSCKIRKEIYRLLGITIEKDVLIYRNVLLLGKIHIGSGSSISNNCSLNGVHAGITIDSNVMIAPGCCIVAFDHGTKPTGVPMIKQPIIESAIYIESDVWIAANCTITAGVRIGTGSVIAANSVVTKNIPPQSIYGGVPARFIKTRQ